MNETLMYYLPLINALFLVALIAGGIHLRFHGERAWTGIGQSQEIQSIKAEIAVLRGNQARFERENLLQHEWRREELDVNRSILTELTAIKAGSTTVAKLEHDTVSLMERIADLEQAIAGLPCSQTACPPTVTKDA